MWLWLARGRRALAAGTVVMYDVRGFWCERRLAGEKRKCSFTDIHHSELITSLPRGHHMVAGAERRPQEAIGSLCGSSSRPRPALRHQQLRLVHGLQWTRFSLGTKRRKINTFLVFLDKIKNYPIYLYISIFFRLVFLSPFLQPTLLSL